MGETNVVYQVGNVGDFTISIDGDVRIMGRNINLDEELGLLQGNLFGIQYEMGGCSNSKNLELKKVLICSEVAAVSIGLGNTASIVSRPEDLRSGFVLIHRSISELFSNNNNAFVGFHMGNLKHHLSELGIPVKAHFIDLTDFKIKNWEKGAKKILGIKKICFKGGEDAVKMVVGGYFSRLVYNSMR